MSAHSRSSDLGIGDSSNQDGANFTNSLLVASGRSDPCSVSRSPSRPSVGGDSTRSDLSPSPALEIDETQRKMRPFAKVCFGSVEVGVTTLDRGGSRNDAVRSDGARYDAADRSDERASKRKWVELGNGEDSDEAKRLVCRDANQGNWKAILATTC